jgi:hypothetical protein
MKLKKILFSFPEKHLFMAAILSGIFYNSWILGYFLNRKEVQNAYYSVLESPGKPHYLFYVFLDLISGFLIILIGLYLNAKIKAYHKIIKYYLVFGSLIILDAIYPITDKCSTTIEACGDSLTQIFSYHDVIGILQFITIFILLKNIKNIANKHHNLKFKKLIKYAFRGYLTTLIIMIISIPLDFMTGLTQGLVIMFTAFTIVLTPLVLVIDNA